LHFFLHILPPSRSLSGSCSAHTTREHDPHPPSLSLSLSLFHLNIILVFWQPLQHTATHCNTLQHTATHCNTLQHTTSEHDLLCCILTTTATHCNTLQHTASHCNTRHLYTIHFLHFGDQCVLRDIDGE